MFFNSIGTYGSDQAMLGVHDKRGNEVSVQLIDIEAKYVHPEYDNPDRSHDVGKNENFSKFVANYCSIDICIMMIPTSSFIPF